MAAKEVRPSRICIWFQKSILKILFDRAHRFFVGEETLSLNPELREMIKAIHEGRLWLLHNLFQIWTDAEVKTNYGEDRTFEKQGGYYPLKQGMMYYLLPTEDELKYLPILDRFKQAIDLLKHEGLIDFDRRREPPFPLFIMKKYGPNEIPAGGIMNEIVGYKDNSITINPSLTTYINRGFRNSEEYKFYREDRRDKRSWRKDMITMGISAIALVISLGTSIRGCIKREDATVHPINITIPRESLPVRIDTVKVHDTILLPLKTKKLRR